MTMGIVLGPMVHSWYGFLDRYYKVTNWKTVLYKILCDQCFGAPTFSFVFITGVKKYPFLSYVLQYLNVVKF